MKRAAKISLDLIVYLLPPLTCCSGSYNFLEFLNAILCTSHLNFQSKNVHQQLFVHGYTLKSIIQKDTSTN